MYLSKMLSIFKVLSKRYAIVESAAFLKVIPGPLTVVDAYGTQLYYKALLLATPVVRSTLASPL